MRKTGALLAAGLIAVLLALPLSAQESGQSRDGPRPAVKLKSEKRAMTLSLVGTIVPLAVSATVFLVSNPSYLHAYIAAAGLLVEPFGPSSGYFYAGATGRAWLGLGIRFAGLAGVFGGAFGLNNDDANETLMKAFIVTGAGVTLASTIIDLAGVKKAVRRHNLKVQGLRVALTPVVSPPSKAFGVEIRLSF